MTATNRRWVDVIERFVVSHRPLFCVIEGVTMYRYYNPNPANKKVGDCVIRAICKATNKPWEKVFSELILTAFSEKDMPSSNAVWGKYLRGQGYKRQAIPNTCPDCYTIEDFCKDNPVGVFILATGSHVVCVVNGDYFDTWESGEETPIYFWEKGK